MRTRSKSNREDEEPTDASNSKNHSNSAEGSRHGESSLAAVSKEGVDKLLKRSRKGGKRRLPSEEKNDELPRENGQCTKVRNLNLGSKGGIGGNAETIMSSKGRDVEGSSYDANEMEWEEGTISLPEFMEGHCNEHGDEVIVEFTESPPSAQKNPPRNVSAEAKELAEVVHKVHLLCLLARGRLVDSACNDPLIQASLLSLLPSNLSKIMEISRLEANMLCSLVKWFRDNFHVRSESIHKGSVLSNLAFALETREGTSEELAALSVALFRALNLNTRFVSILDVSSLKPDTELVRVSNQDSPWLDTRLLSVATALSSSNKHHVTYPAHLSDTKKSDGAQQHQSSSSKLDRQENNTTCRNHLLEGFSAANQSGDGTGHATETKAWSDSSDSCFTKSAEGLKRKGDLEFELQLEMALSATGSGAHDSKLGPSSDELHSNSSSLASPMKKLKETKVKGASVSTFGGQGSSSAVWSRKNGPPLYWAEVYCNGETYSGRWVHIDAANGIVDGEEKVEAAAAACRRPLKYVVAFSGNGAKDVTRRYCLQWYKIAPRRTNAQWWDTVLAPLKELESGVKGGMVQSEAYLKNTSGAEKNILEGIHPMEVHSSTKTKCSSPEEYAKDSGGPSKETVKHADKPRDMGPPSQFPTHCSGILLEDMELETRALTEPLPTNQQAYKSHHLYAIERWLTMHQVLHPRGPILGYCKGHPVYPRSCIQTVQTKHRWLKEGLQVRENEVPAKILKKSRKNKKVQISELTISEEDDGEKSIELYGKWQLELLQLPHAVNGVVPKNEWGRVDAWSEKCLPPGTVHLRVPRIVSVAKRLGIDFAPAMVGFEFRNGRSFPVYEGIVVCTEFRDAIMEAYREEEERRETEERKRNEAQALSRWYQLLSSIITRNRLENYYVDQSSLYKPQDAPPDRRDRSTAQNSSSSSRSRIPPGRALQRPVPNARLVSPADDDHEHVFPVENQSFDEESMVRTKRCSCGFSIQVEEL
ncbi:DNA repair protein RAD4 isoform X1 [Iris pallida]|uniref:DNA repair protein RAD4 isoform X1 n=1 Tax=Iris pallida TaxID=29817 RepID=A0AAX6DXS6_IRIPA|nr:DNA repair protein RAD4 isoform X1 [Iris pallida]